MPAWSVACRVDARPVFQLLPTSPRVFPVPVGAAWQLGVLLSGLPTARPGPHTPHPGAPASSRSRRERYARLARFSGRRVVHSRAVGSCPGPFTPGRTAAASSRIPTGALWVLGFHISSFFAGVCCRLLFAFWGWRSPAEMRRPAAARHARLRRTVMHEADGGCWRPPALSSRQPSIFDHSPVPLPFCLRLSKSAARSCGSPPSVPISP